MDEPVSPRHNDRRAYLDWLRGVGVLIMIAAHTLDSWTRPGDRSSGIYQWAMIIAGFGAPIFLFLAGLAIPLAANARLRRGMSAPDVVRRSMRRAWQVFGLAFLFRLQSLLISGGGLRAFLKVDILNVMGASMLTTVALWQVGRSTRSRVLLFAVATLAVAMLTPPTRSTPLLDSLPDPIEAYLRPEPGRTTFTLLPWGGFVFAGAIAGIWLDAGSKVRESRRVAWLAAAGLAIAALGYGAASLPSIYEQSSYWTSSPTFFFVRVGLVAALVGAAFAWLRVWGGRRSPLQELGVSSLFVYWIHVEMVYGVLSAPLHRALPLGGVFVAMTVFSVCLFALVRLKNQLGRRPPRGENASENGTFRTGWAFKRPYSG